MLLLAVLFCLTACGSKDKEENTETAAPTAAPTLEGTWNLTGLAEGVPERVREAFDEALAGGGYIVLRFEAEKAYIRMNISARQEFVYVDGKGTTMVLLGSGTGESINVGTFREEGGKLIITYDSTGTKDEFDYTLNGDTLQIQMAEQPMIFTREK